MPVMDGFEFLDRMRESRYHKGLPVIVITVKRTHTGRRSPVG